MAASASKAQGKQSKNASMNRGLRAQGAPFVSDENSLHQNVLTSNVISKCNDPTHNDTSDTISGTGAIAEQHSWVTHKHKRSSGGKSFIKETGPKGNMHIERNMIITPSSPHDHYTNKVANALDNINLND